MGTILPTINEDPAFQPFKQKYSIFVPKKRRTEILKSD